MRHRTLDRLFWGTALGFCVLILVAIFFNWWYAAGVFVVSTAVIFALERKVKQAYWREYGKPQRPGRVP